MFAEYGMPALLRRKTRIGIFMRRYVIFAYALLYRAFSAFDQRFFLPRYCLFSDASIVAPLFIVEFCELPPHVSHNGVTKQHILISVHHPLLSVDGQTPRAFGLWSFVLLSMQNRKRLDVGLFIQKDFVHFLPVFIHGKVEFHRF